MKKIAIDCGHGMNTLGKRTPNGIHEWELNDKVRKQVAKILSDYDVEIIYTDGNEGNTDESLAKRLKQYLNAGVDAFVSIHHNAYNGKWNNVTGVEVYTDKNPTSQDIQLANCIYPKLVAYTGLTGRGIKKENWYVINQNRIPAVLVEGGFMDSNKDYKVITSEAGQLAYGKAVAEGLIEFLGLSKKVATTPQPTSIQNTTNNSFEMKVKVLTTYNIRKTPDMGNNVVGTVGKGVYTIVEYVNGWGRLKSGAGWIYVENKTYVQKISAISATSTTQKRKTNEQIALEVKKGLWGNEPIRSQKLKDAGYDYQAIRALVNKK